jgi:hypothetical protein
MLRQTSLCAILWFSLSVCTFATSGEMSMYIDQIVRDDPASLKSVSRHLIQMRIRDREVLDVLAEVVVQKAFTANRYEVDAIAWAIRALGETRDSRYRTALDRVYRSHANSKIRRYARAAIYDVGRGGPQYEPGSIDLQELQDRRKGQPVYEPKQPAPREEPRLDPKTAEPVEYAHISKVRSGMSMEQVIELVGPPTSTSARATGKAFVPFYHGGDASRLIAFYKGQGRIIFNRHSRYDSTLRVLEVQYNEAEIGYP